MPSIVLTWAASPATDNVIAYEVWGANGTGTVFGSCTKLATVNALTWTDVGLPASQARTYYIRSLNIIGPSAPEGPLNITTAALSSAYVNNLGGAPSVQEGAHTGRPAAGAAGAIYIETDTKTIWRDNGTAWDQIGGSTEASNADVWTGADASKVITPNRLFAANASQALTDAATITIDGNTGFNFHVTLGGNRTLANPTNMKTGQSGRIRVTQDGTGSRTLVFGTNWLFAGGDPTMSTAAGAKDAIAYYCHSSTEIEATFAKALS